MEAETGASACAALAVTDLRDAKPKTTARVIAAAAIFLTERISSFIRHPPEAFAYKSRFAFVISSFATCLQRFCFTSATLASQELHRNVSPSRDFSRFFQGKCKKSKSKGLKAFHECNNHITDSASYVPCVLQFSSKSGFCYNFLLRFDFRNVFCDVPHLYISAFQFISMYKSEVQHTNPLFSVRRSMPEPHFRNKKGKAAAKCSRPASSGSALNFPLSSLCLITAQQKKESGSEEPPSHNSGDAIEKDASSDH